MEVFDLTGDDVPFSLTTITKKRASSSSSSKPKKVAKKDSPHVLLWMVAAGKGQSRTWTQKALRVIGIYPSKADAESKKHEITDQHQCNGYGNLITGPSWEDEIELVIRPVEEVNI